MTIIVEGISDKALKRLMRNSIANKVDWAGIRLDGETDVCFGEGRYVIYTGKLFDGREYIEIKSHDKAFVLMCKEYNRVIVE